MSFLTYCTHNSFPGLQLQINWCIFPFSSSYPKNEFRLAPSRFRPIRTHSGSPTSFIGPSLTLAHPRRYTSTSAVLSNVPCILQHPMSNACHISTPWEASCITFGREVEDHWSSPRLARLGASRGGGGLSSPTTLSCWMRQIQV